MSIGLIVLIIVGLLGVYLAGLYNKLTTLRNQVKNAWSQIDVQLQRRYDLIPNLVETVKAYKEYEKSTLEGVIAARNQARAALEALQESGGPTAGSLKQLISAETGLKSAMGSIFALAENYPQLRASENMARLQEELSTTENTIAFARQAYNDQVLGYNTAQQKVPAVFVASLFGHHLADLYEIEEEGAKKAVRVSL